MSQPRTFESALGNLLEGLRFVGDRYGNRPHPDGIPMVTHVVEMLGVLWHVGQVRKQQVLLAAMLLYPKQDQLCSEAESVAIFGELVSSYLHQTQDIPALIPRPMQRLRLKREQNRLQAARQILLADAIVLFRRQPDRYQIPTEYQSFRGLVPLMDQHLTQLETQQEDQP